MRRLKVTIPIKMPMPIGKRKKRFLRKFLKRVAMAWMTFV